MVGNPSIPAITLVVFALHSTRQTPHHVTAKEASSTFDSSHLSEHRPQRKHLRRRDDFVEQRGRFRNITSTSSTIDPPSESTKWQRQLKPCNGWHPELDKADGCTDDTNYPDQWMDPNMGLIGMFHTSAEACCDYFFGSGCEIYDTGCGGTSASPPSEPPSRVVSPPPPVIVSTSPTNAATPPPTKAASLPPTEAATEVLLAWATRLPPPETSDPSTQNAVSPPTSYNDNCISPGWHPNINSNDGCSNDENYPSQWLNSERVKGNMFQASLQKCCDRFFKDRDCKEYDDGCTIDFNMEQPLPGTRPTKEPTSKPTSVAPTVTPPEYYIVHGIGTCVDGNEIPRPYYTTEFFRDIIECCLSSFAKDRCLAALPDEVLSQIPDTMVEVTTFGTLTLQLSTIPKHRTENWSKLKSVLTKTVALVMVKSPIAGHGIEVELLTFAGQSFRWRRSLGESVIEDENDQVALSSLQSRAKRRASSSQQLQFNMKIPARCDASCQSVGGYLGHDAFDELESHLQYYVTSGVVSYVLTKMGKSAGLFSEARVTSATLSYRSAVESAVTFMPTWSPTDELPPTSMPNRPTISPSSKSPSEVPTESPSYQPTSPPEPTSSPTTKCSAAKWYYKLGFNFCTNDSDYPSLYEGTRLLSNTVDECCSFHSPGVICAVRDICDTTSSYCGGLYHPTTPDLRTCSNSHEYPPAWNNNEKFMFRSAEACCATFYRGRRCFIKDACY